ncbi:MAG TPA: lytic transglycosylase domain-containing protein [Pyrinomonadaceae bacterium]|nr:lytic transglycosylase domain-containing protein [Pyrinomonadaceae bacterium]
MRRYIVLILILLTVSSAVGLYFFRDYWIHRYDEMIARYAKVYHLEEKLVWSVIYQETYFQAWKIGADKEVGLMQVTPTVAREWAKKTQLQEFEKQTEENVNEFLRDPETNIQVGCWYLEKMRENYRGFPAEIPMTLAAYNAGASRVTEWSKSSEEAKKMTEEEFIKNINISSTKAYVSEILERFRTAETRSK